MIVLLQYGQMNGFVGITASGPMTKGALVRVEIHACREHVKGMA